MIPAPLVRFFARPYVAGDSLGAALEVVKSGYANATNSEKRQNEDEFYFTIDMLGEEVHCEEDAKHYVQQYQKVCDGIVSIGSEKTTTISLKPTAMGLRLNYGLCRDNIEQVVAYAQKRNIGVTLDMEDSSTTDDTLKLYRYLRQRYNNVGTVLQARLFRTFKDINDLVQVGGRIRWCMGAYPEPPEIAFQNREAIKQAMFSLGTLLLELGLYTEFATHDEALLDKFIHFAQSNHIPCTQFEFQYLMGVPHIQYLKDKYCAYGVLNRIYVPFCLKWSDAIRYLRRRMLENPHLVWYVFKNLIHR